MELIFGLHEIEVAAKRFLSETAGYRVFAFHGEMGAGKTTFIHALCGAMGVKDRVSSPTFSIINEYIDGMGQPVYHIDLYRIGNESAAIGAGVEDALYSGHTCLVEWPGLASGILPPDTLHIKVSPAGTNTRKLEINQ